MATVTRQTTTVERHSEVAAIAVEWEELAQRLGAPPFAFPGWFETWYGVFGTAVRLILAARRDGRLVGVLPLERRPTGLHGAANWHTPVFAPPVEDDEAAAGLMAALARERARKHDLTLLDASDPLLRHAARRSLVRVVARQPWVDASGSFDAYLASLSRKRRKEIARLSRRVEEAGAASYEFHSGGELHRRLEEGLAIEGSGWKAREGTAIASDMDVARFYRSLARWAADRGWLTLAFLRVGGRAIAFDMQLEAAGATYVLKGGFDPDWRRFSPGTLLTRAALARAFADPAIRSYEFLGDADEYKLAWTGALRERVRLQSFPRTPAGALNRAAHTHGRRAALRLLAAVRRSS